MAGNHAAFSQSVHVEVIRKKPRNEYLKTAVICEKCGNKRKWLVRCEYCGSFIQLKENPNGHES